MLTTWLMYAICCNAAVTAIRGPHHPRGPHGHYHPRMDGTKLTQDVELLQDVTHLEEDLENTISRQDIENMTPEEKEFHYFKLHDFDNNTKLDGLEILQAIRHTLEHEESQAMKESHGGVTTETPSSSTEDLDYFVELIDLVLAEDDTDRDGYLSYVEYVVGRQRDSHRRKSLESEARSSHRNLLK